MVIIENVSNKYLICDGHYWLPINNNQLPLWRHTDGNAIFCVVCVTTETPSCEGRNIYLLLDIAFSYWTSSFYCRENKLEVSYFLWYFLVSSLISTKVLIYSSHSYIIHVWHIFFSSDTQAYCPEGYVLYNGRCFGVESTELSFQEAENVGNKLPGGHLAAFRDDSEREFLQGLRYDSIFETRLGMV